MKKLPTYGRVPRHKKFNGKWYIISNVIFAKKNTVDAAKTCEKVYGDCKTMEYRHKSGAVEYAIYARNPRGKYGQPPRRK